MAPASNSTRYEEASDHLLITYYHQQMDIDAPPSPITTADAPFNDPTDNVDLVIRTADNVDFFVLSALLSLQSPSSFFRHALQDSQHTEERDNHPILNVKEDSDTFRTILLFCYPYVVPKFESAKQIQEVGVALDKYCMDHAMERFVEAVLVSSVISEQPLRVFAPAVANGWKEIGEAAARNTLAMPLSQAISDVEELDGITGRHLYRLQDYHTRCGKAAQIPAWSGGSLPWLNGKTAGLLFLHPSNTTACRWCFNRPTGLTHVTGIGGSSFYSHPWFNTYLTMVNNRVLSQPQSQVALDDYIIDQAVHASTKQCSPDQWTTIAGSQIRLLGKILAEEIDRRISEVPMGIEWKKIK